MDVKQLAERVNGLLVTVCSAQQIIMVAGFTLFQAGVVQPKNVTSVLIKSLFDLTLSCLTWWLIGYALAFGSTEGGFIGKDLGNFALRDARVGSASWDRFFWTYGAVAVSNTIFGRAAFSERASLLPSMIFNFLATSFIYPVFVHWTWGQGWLSAWGAMPDSLGLSRPMLSQSMDSNGMIDCSGAGMIHLAGGSMALMGTIVIGSRTDRFALGSRTEEVEYGNKTLQYLGLLMVWFATYAVYLGPIVFLQNANLAGLSAINITLSAASSSVTSIVLCALLDDAMDITVVLNGILAGLVAVSASFCLVLPWHALITGFVGGIFYNCGRKLLWYLHVDDPCDAISVHLFVGLWALWSVGIFCTDDNVRAAGYSNLNSACARGEQFGVQIVGSLAIMSWASVTSGIILGIMRLVGLDLRVETDIEDQGVDILFGAPTNPGPEIYADKEASNKPNWLAVDNGQAFPNPITDPSGEANVAGVHPAWTTASDDDGEWLMQAGRHAELPPRDPGFSFEKARGLAAEGTPGAYAQYMSWQNNGLLQREGLLVNGEDKGADLGPMC